MINITAPNKMNITVPKAIDRAVIEMSLSVVPMKEKNELNHLLIGQTVFS